MFQHSTNVPEESDINTHNHNWITFVGGMTNQTFDDMMRQNLDVKNLSFVA